MTGEAVRYVKHNTSKEPNKAKSSKSRVEEIEDYYEDALPSIVIEEDSNSINSTTIELEDNKQDWKSLCNEAILSYILATSSSIVDPRTYKEVILHKDKDRYLEAIKIEINDLSNSTWDLIVEPKKALL